MNVPEATYIRTVWNWQRASDERGLSSLQRCKYNYQFLYMILKDQEMYDFILLEVNRFDFLLFYVHFTLLRVF